jgi:hypothetical protein
MVQQIASRFELMSLGMQFIMTGRAFQVGRYVSAWFEGFLHGPLNPRGGAMRVCQGSAFGKDHVHFHPMRIADVPVAQLVGETVPGSLARGFRSTVSA